MWEPMWEHAIKATPEVAFFLVNPYGAEGDRTPGLLIANQALCQLSYSPVSNRSQMVRDALQAVESCSFNCR